MTLEFKLEFVNRMSTFFSYSSLQ